MPFIRPVSPWPAALRRKNTMQNSSRDLPRTLYNVGALVAGGDYQGLGIVRSLGRQGLPVCVIDDEPSISRFSRYTSRYLRLDDMRDPDRIVESVLSIGRKHALHGWVIYPTRDEIVAAFSRRREELSEIYRVPTPGWNTVKAAWDKRQTYAIACELGIPTPRTQFASDALALSRQVVEMPVALKPAIKEHFIYTTRVKALRADSREELEALYDRVCTVIPGDEVLLQELIPGSGESQFSYCTFFKNGAPLAKMTARRVRQHPMDFGRSSTYVETVEIPEIEGPSERFLSAIDYYGLAELEYKYDARDRQYKLLDVNLRTWGYHSIGRRAGVDFPYLLFRDQMGEEVEPCRAETGIRWIRISTDLPTALGEVLRGRMAMRAFLRSLKGLNIEAVFERGDLLPAFAEFLHLPYLYRTRGTSGWGKEK
jgi:D-aspartate ligase